MFQEESQDIEYKESWKDEYLKWICGFANVHGGKIFIGINDERKVVGIKHSKQLMEDIPNKIVTTLGIVADVNLHHQDNFDYIEICIEPSNIPIAYKGTPPNPAISTLLMPSTRQASSSHGDEASA